ncbi:uncharacterized protein LOC6560039 [Drosophila grimshawi]|uniref:GH20177 n=1 Tax=Drosophila grimshawi TaxID=7222 RepID=B4J665_DROGR|nr:uncharacterized protein LOC6560039 [Drosophila grimshawi]EDW01923.1 GH20177 [Drosophila grimshawi]
MALNTQTKQTSRQRLRGTIWTREKIYRLIELYRASDCLWNHYSELYKNKDCRNKAIDHICSTLGITKLDYGKKVHNLRNQFNSELKKYERRLAKTGENSDETVKACRWEHFDKLMFLQPIIEPRPGFQPQCKKTTRNNKLKLTETNIETEKEQKSNDSIIQLLSVEETNNGIAKEKSTCELQRSPACDPRRTSPNLMHGEQLNYVTTSRPSPPRVNRDQWDAFGELIANEFRNLNSAISRKKLQRKIMRIMLEVGEEDDQKYTNTN